MNQAMILTAEKEDLGGFFVHRALPGPNWRYIGPFVFFDHMGPMQITDTQAVDVRPHPHIGLATVTYLFEGRITHRDSLGSNQVITPGDINWMTAGRGIVHSEHTPTEDRNPADQNRAHGIQIWVGLPKSQEECAPTFTHTEKEKLPTFDLTPSLSAKVMLGELNGNRSPIQTLSRMLFLDLKCSGDTETLFSKPEKEMGFYLVSGEASVNGKSIKPYDMAFFDQATEVKLQIKSGARMIVIGGDALPENRYMWWNFVSSSKERIEKAKADWVNQKMGTVPGEAEYAPLPEHDD